MAKLSTILDQIDAGSMLLPEFQRGYVWNRDQVRGLMRSLYHGYPVGALLVWETEGNAQEVRGGIMTAGPKQLLLDGQQRVTTLSTASSGAEPRPSSTAIPTPSRACGSMSRPRPSSSTPR